MKPPVKRREQSWDEFIWESYIPNPTRRLVLALFAVVTILLKLVLPQIPIILLVGLFCTLVWAYPWMRVARWILKTRILWPITGMWFRLRGRSHSGGPGIFYYLTTPSVVHEKISPYFTRRLKLVGMISFLVAWISLTVFFGSEMFDDPNLYYSFFGTVVQGFMALSAFLESIAIFRLQAVESELGPVVREASIFLDDTHGPFYLSEHTASGVIKKIRTLFSFMDQGISYEGTEEAREKLKDFLDRVNWLNYAKMSITKQATSFFFLAITVVTVSLMLMPLTNLLADTWYLGAVLVFVVTYVCLLTIRGAWGLIGSMLAAR